MNKKIKKIIAIGLSVLTFSSCAIPVMAATSYKDSTASVIEDINGTDIQGNDTVQKEETQYSEYSEDTASTTDVYVTQKSTFSVVAPVIAVLNGKAGEQNTGDIRYKVSGNIASDEIIAVEPDATFNLSQAGKDDILCTVDAKDTITDFTYANGVRPNTFLTRDYTITANNMTAGSWHGSYSTNISLIPHYRYYTSFENAISDLNSGKYDNADLYTAEPENALCALYFGETTNEIVMFKNAENIDSVTVEKNLRLDLRGNTITFANGKYLTYNSNLRVENGTINAVDSNYIISSLSTNTASTLSLKGLNLNETVTENISTSAHQINTYSLNNNFNDIEINTTGNGNSSYGVYGITFRNADSVNEADSYSFISDVSNALRVRAMQLGGSSTLNKPVVNISSDKAEITGILATSDNEKVVINDANVKVIASSNNATKVSGMNLYPKIAEINGCKVFADAPNSTGVGSGLALQTKEKTIIKSTKNNPVTVYGNQWGLQTSPYGTTTINGGTYTSTNHTGYICGNADIYNAEFYISNRENYSSPGDAFGLYCGSKYCPQDAVVNFYNCTTGNPKDSTQQHQSCIVAQKNYGYISPAEINIYDCDLYQGKDDLFLFNRPQKWVNGTMTTKFNLYGNTKLYDVNGIEITKVEFAEIIATWKDSVSLRSDWQSIGNNYIRAQGETLYDYDETTDTYSNCHLDENANVYDYR